MAVKKLSSQQFLNFVILFGCIFLGLFGCTPPSPSKPIRLQNLNGELVDFKKLKGKWIFINYWAPWCKPCLQEISELNQFSQHYATEVHVFGVNFDEPPLAKQRQAVKKFKIAYPSLQQNPATQLKLTEVQTVPTTFVINPQGKMVAVLQGPQTVSSLSKILTN